MAYYRGVSFTEFIKNIRQEANSDPNVVSVKCSKATIGHPTCDVCHHNTPMPTTTWLMKMRNSPESYLVHCMHRPDTGTVEVSLKKDSSEGICESIW